MIEHTRIYSSTDGRRVSVTPCVLDVAPRPVLQVSSVGGMCFKDFGTVLPHKTEQHTKRIVAPSSTVDIAQ